MAHPVWRALRSPRWIARLVFLVGTVSVLSAFSPGFRERTQLVYEVVPDLFPAAATTGTAAIGLILIALAHALRRGKFRAWLLALVLSVVATGLHLLKGLDVEEAALTLGLAVLLAAGRPSFTARPDPRSLRHVLLVLVSGPLIATALGWAWLTVIARGQAAGTSWDQRLAQAALGLVGIPGPVEFTGNHSADASATALAVLGGAVLLVAVLAALRPAGGPHPLSPDEVVRLRSILERWSDRDSLGYFGLRDDRAAVFAPRDRAAVTYRVVGGVTLAGGDPIGNPDSWDSAIGAWLDEARSFGWTPAALGASEQGARAYQRAGLEVLELGDEAVIRPDEFTLEGRAMRGVRHAVARCERAGIRTETHRLADLDPMLLERIRRKADIWRDGAVERGFSMALGRFGDPDDTGTVVVLARRGEEVVGLLHFVPWGSDGLSLDLMRRSRDCENGVVETMVAGLMADAPALGLTRVSLNFAVFRGVFARGERLGAGPATRLWRAVLLAASRFWQIESLYRANAKYRPEWVPRYLVYPGAGDLARVVTAALRAEAFLVAPSWFGRAAQVRRLGSIHATDRTVVHGTPAPEAR